MPTPSLRHKLDGDARAWVGALQIVDQLLQILDRVYVVMRRRRDKPHAGGGMPRARNGFRDLVAGKLASLARLGTLRHLDLELIRVGKVVGGDTKSTRCNLLDGRAHGSRHWACSTALRVLATLTSVGLAAQTVHGDGQGRVRLHGDGAVRHGTREEASNNLGPGLDLVDGDGGAFFESKFEHAAEGAVLDLLILGHGVCLVGFVVLGSDCILDVGDADGVVDVSLAAITPMVLARLGKTRDRDGCRGMGSHSRGSAKHPGRSARMSYLECGWQYP